MLTEEVVYPVNTLAMDNSLSFSVQIFPFFKGGGFLGSWRCPLLCLGDTSLVQLTLRGGGGSSLRQHSWS